MKYFVYYFTGIHYIYERTCGTEDAAKARVAVLIERGHQQALYTINHTIRGALY